MENKQLSSERYETILRSISDGVISTDIRGHIELLNPVAETLTGWTQAEAQGRHLSEVFNILNEETGEPAGNPVEELLKNGKAQAFGNHSVLVCRDGAEHIITYRVTHIRDEKDMLTGAVLVFRDQTQERMAQKALLDSKKMLQNIMDNSSSLIYVFDLQGRFLFANRALISLLNTTQDKLIGHKRDEFLPAVIARRHRENDIEVISSMKPLLLEEKNIEPDGLHYYFSVKFPLIDSSGELFAVSGISTDITERKWLEEDIIENTKKFKTSVENLLDAFGIYSAIRDQEGKIIDFRVDYVNTAACKLNLMTKEDQIGERLLDILPGHRESELFKEYCDVVETGRPFEKDAFCYTDFYGEKKLSRGFDIRVVKLGDGFIASWRDVTERLKSENEIAEAARQWQYTFDAANVVIWILDKENRIIRSNKLAESYFGISCEKLVGKLCSEIVHGSKEPVTGCPVIRASKSLKCEKFELMHGDRWFEVTADPMLDSDGNYNGAIHIIDEITERKKKEIAIQESEAKYADLYENAPDIYLSLNPETGRIERCNQTMVHSTGFTKDEIIGKSIFELYHPDFIDKAKNAFQFFVKNGSVRDIELQILCKDGSKMDVSLNVSAVRDSSGKILQSRSILRDINARKKAENALQESERLYRSLVNHLPQKIFLKDRNSVYISCNARYAKDLGIEPFQITGKNDFDFFPEDLAVKYRSDDQEVIRADTIRDFEEKYFLGGQEKWVHTVKIPYHDIDDSITGILGIFEDITSRKHAENERAKLWVQLLQAQKMESVGRLAGGVAHDFNNMLSVILGFSQISLMQLNAADPLYGNLEEISKAARRSADITRQLLAFARKQVVEPRVLDVNDTIAGMLKMLRRLIGEEIDLAWMPGVGVWQIKIDPSQVDQILANLIVNARDAIAGTGKITIESQNITLDTNYCNDHAGFIPGAYVMLAVSDDGCGMDDETIAHIFEPFFTTKEPGQGTGLGLATVYGIVKQNNGFINVYSELGVGTTFKMFLPRFTENVEEIKTEVVEEISGGHGETILIVEDEPLVVKLSSNILEKLNYIVLTAETPRQAIQIALTCNEKIHLLITDVIMPEMNGKELAARLNEIIPGLKCLYISGYTSNVITHHSILEDGVNFLAKPFSMQELASKVNKVLGQK